MNSRLTKEQKAQLRDARLAALPSARAVVMRGIERGFDGILLTPLERELVQMAIKAVKGAR